MNFDRYCQWADLPDWLGTISSSGRIGLAGFFHIFLFTDWCELVMTRVARLHRSYKTPESWENVTRSLIQRPRSFNHKVYLENVGVYQSKMPIWIKAISLSKRHQSVMITQSTLVYDLNADTHFSLTAVSYWGTYITISGKKIMWKDGLNKVTTIFVIDAFIN